MDPCEIMNPELFQEWHIRRQPCFSVTLPSAALPEGGLDPAEPMGLCPRIFEFRIERELGQSCLGALMLGKLNTQELLVAFLPAM